MIKLKWLIAHQPAYLFVRTAKAFVDEINKTCPGEFDIEILTMKDYIEQYNDIPELAMKPAHVKGVEKPHDEMFEEVKWSDVGRKWSAFFRGLREQKFDISQTQITVLGGHLHKVFSTLDLPFLFKDHDHATRVLDGEIGKKMREQFSKATGINSLAFTYSGGFRIIGSEHDIEDIHQLADVNLQTTPVTRHMWNELNAKAFPRMGMDIQETNDAVGDKGAVETTYLRFDGKNILKTNHSMFLTSIICGRQLLNRLTDKQKKAFEEAAFKVGKIERKWSLEDCEKFENTAKERGVQIRSVTKEEDEKMRDAALASYDAFLHNEDRKFGADSFREGLVDQIQKA